MFFEIHEFITMYFMVTRLGFSINVNEKNYLTWLM